jgi:hypothetical protein
VQRNKNEAYEATARSAVQSLRVATTTRMYKRKLGLKYSRRYKIIPPFILNEADPNVKVVISLQDI